MRQPTSAEKKKFQKACKTLRELSDLGFQLYLAESMMHLMVGDSHANDRNSTAQQQNSADSAYLGPGAGGGDW